MAQDGVLPETAVVCVEASTGAADPTARACGRARVVLSAANPLSGTLTVGLRRLTWATSTSGLGRYCQFER